MTKHNRTVALNEGRSTNFTLGSAPNPYSTLYADNFAHPKVQDVGQRHGKGQSGNVIFGTFDNAMKTKTENQERFDDKSPPRNKSSESKNTNDLRRENFQLGFTQDKYSTSVRDHFKFSEGHQKRTSISEIKKKLMRQNYSIGNGMQAIGSSITASEFTDKNNQGVNHAEFPNRNKIGSLKMGSDPQQWKTETKISFQEKQRNEKKMTKEQIESQRKANFSFGNDNMAPTSISKITFTEKRQQDSISPRKTGKYMETHFKIQDPTNNRQSNPKPKLRSQSVSPSYQVRTEKSNISFSSKAEKNVETQMQSNFTPKTPEAIDRSKMMNVHQHNFKFGNSETEKSSCSQDVYKPRPMTSNQAWKRDVANTTARIKQVNLNLGDFAQTRITTTQDAHRSLTPNPRLTVAKHISNVTFGHDAHEPTSTMKSAYTQKASPEPAVPISNKIPALSYYGTHFTPAKSMYNSNFNWKQPF